MTAPRTTIWNISNVTRTKHDILRKYLQWWFPTMLQAHEKVTLLDGFAGPGEYVEGDSGSPLIALDILRSTLPSKELSRAKLHFIEKSKRRANHLYKLIEKNYFADSTLTKPPYIITQRPFAPTVEMHMERLKQHNNTLHPAFIFIDPFGFKDTPSSLLVQLAQQPDSDMLITFMYEEINRFLSSTDKKIQRHLDSLFGNTQWHAIRDCQEPETREEALCNCYCQHMKQMSNVKYACRFRMKNDGNRTDYFLFFFTSNRKHLEQMKQVFWDIDPFYGSTFSEKESKKQQPYLFFPEVDYRMEQLKLRQQFQGQTINVNELDEYALAETTFCSQRYKEYLLIPLERSASITITSYNLARQPGEYIETDRIYFPPLM
jgi:hypothetical protein